MTLKRKQDWPERLHEALVARHHKTFAWGQTDCLLTVCDFILALTGSDPGAPFRGRYSSATGALRTAAEQGCDSFEALVVKVAGELQFPEISPRLAQRGDLVLFDGQNGVSFGVVHLNGRDAVFAAESGLQRVPVLSARRAWRI